MGKWYGSVGFGLTTQKETAPGVYEVTPVEKKFYGDIIRNTMQLENSDNLNDNINISNKISIIADQWVYMNMHEIKYVTFNGQKWKVKSVDAEPPRLILTLGGLYVEQQN